MKKEIIKILKEFDECHFCEDEGGIELKIKMYLPEILGLFDQQKEEFKKMVKKRRKGIEADARFYNQALEDILKAIEKL